MPWLMASSQADTWTALRVGRGTFGAFFSSEGRPQDFLSCLSCRGVRGPEPVVESDLPPEILWPLSDLRGH